MAMEFAAYLSIEAFSPTLLRPAFYDIAGQYRRGVMSKECPILEIDDHGIMGWMEY